MSKNTSHQASPHLPSLTLAALGVVYGDIGTSPLYTLKEVFSESHHLLLQPTTLLGVLSTIVWMLIIIVTIKYVLVLLRTDNQGEGGLLALTALALRANRTKQGLRRVLMFVGVLGTALFYGDSMITPAISVIGAVEGLIVLEPTWHEFVLPLTLIIIIFLFALQRFGTGLIGQLFGPVLILWFSVLGLVGLWHIVQEPLILNALNPWHAITFLQSQSWHVFVVMGAIVLALTGAEALYADMGHFGARPIQFAWFGLVFPALALNYLGQGALLLHDPSAITNPFFNMYPAFLLMPMIILACLAAIIASQAVISGAYSITRQAISLGFFPRLSIRFTSMMNSGQIYIPIVNTCLFLGVLLIVLVFRSADAMANAYGLAVTLTMLISTLVLICYVSTWTHFLRWPLLIGTMVFLVFEGLFFIGTLYKFIDGGWVTLVIAVVLFLMMSTWWFGRLKMKRALNNQRELLPFLQSLEQEALPRVDRVAVYLVSDPHSVPHALLHHLKHQRSLHDINLLVHVQFHDIPHIPFHERIHVEHVEKSFWQVEVHFGFKQSPNIPKALALCREAGLSFELDQLSYYLSREWLVLESEHFPVIWRDRLFLWMYRQTGEVSEYFKLPENQVVQYGTKVKM